MVRKNLIFCAQLASGVLLSTISFSQVKIGANPTVIEGSSSLEIEATTDSRKVKVDKTTGKFTISDGTQGTGKVLTSDANGGASWQTSATLRIPETVFIGQQTGSYTVTPFVLPHDALKDRVPLVPSAGSLAGYSTTDKQYVIQSDGYYRIHIGGRITGTLGGIPVTVSRIYLGVSNQAAVLNQFDGPATGRRPTLSTFWEGYLTAGETVDIYIYNVANGGPDQNLVLDRSYLSVTKLF